MTICYLLFAIHYSLKSDPCNHLAGKNQAGLTPEKLKQNRHAVTPRHLPFKDRSKPGKRALSNEDWLTGPVWTRFKLSHPFRTPIPNSLYYLFSNLSDPTAKLHKVLYSLCVPSSLS